MLITLVVSRFYCRTRNSKLVKCFESGRSRYGPLADFVSVMRDARRRGANFNLELTSVNPGRFKAGEVFLEVIAPSQEFASRTPQGRIPGGRQVTANSMSAVVRVWGGGSPRLLLAGDVDQLGLNELLGLREDLEAEVLVYPHHGGLPGSGNASGFTKTLIEAVEPRVVVFSIARPRRQLPRPDVVAAVLQYGTRVHVACTQLSQHCAADISHDRADFHAGVAKVSMTMHAAQERWRFR